MDCKNTDELIHRGRLDELSPAEQREFETHLEGCPRCSELVHPDLFAAPLQPPQGLLSSILAETGGPACGRAGELLAERLDGELENLDNRLVDAHADDCVDCDALRSTFAHLAVDLPALQEMQPDTGFANDVFALTSRSPNLRASRSSERLQRLWQRLVQRPRFAWEAAYVGTMMLWLLMGLPLVGLPDTPPNVREYLPDLAGSRSAIQSLRDPVSDLSRRTLSSARDGLSSTTEELQQDFRRRGDDLRNVVNSLDLEKSGQAVKTITADAVETVNRFLQEEDNSDQ